MMWEDWFCVVLNGMWVLLQAVSVIHAHNVIGVAIRRFSAPNNVIREGHCAVGVMPNINSCANIVMNLSGKISPFPRGYLSSRG